MKIEFHKYQGTGNDFILIDNRKEKVKNDLAGLAQCLCDRHFGIGSDGLILIENSDSADFKMIFYNPDGSQSFCGNGSRCAMHFAIDLGIIGPKAKFSAIDGDHEGKIISSEFFAIKMADVKTIEEIGKDLFLNTGSPHYIVQAEDVNGIDLITEAHKIRYNERFAKVGSNINYVELTQSGIKIRTYERGVEDETLSCGTGVTATALAAHFKGWVGQESINVETRGGNLEVKFNAEKNNSFTNIWLIGPAKIIFTGQIEI